MKIFDLDDLKKLYQPSPVSNGEDNGPRTDLAISQILRVCVDGVIVRG
ncbi:MAG TPA: hypothetical protein VI819_02905 [Patescibacteria group bacterium]|nr:hypothetical protein [Patescibacteria group bacterium]